MSRCRTCLSEVVRGQGHHESCRHYKEPVNARGYGVYPHAVWIEGKGVVETAGGGFVTRPVGDYVPYGRMTPIRVFKRKADADRFGDKLTFGRDRKRRRGRDEVESVGHHGYAPPSQQPETRMQYLRRIAERRRRYARQAQFHGEQGPGYDQRRRRRSRRRRR